MTVPTKRILITLALLLALIGLLIVLTISYYLASPFLFFSSLKSAFLAGDPT
jgi:hypothetical protein